MPWGNGYQAAEGRVGALDASHLRLPEDREFAYVISSLELCRSDTGLGQPLDEPGSFLPLAGHKFPDPGGFKFKRLLVRQVFDVSFFVDHWFASSRMKYLKVKYLKDKNAH